MHLLSREQPTRYKKTQWYEHIKDTCIWDGWVFISGQDACFTLTGKHDREFHPNTTHIWVYTGTEPLPLSNQAELVADLCLIIWPDC